MQAWRAKGDRMVDTVILVEFIKKMQWFAVRKLLDW